MNRALLARELDCTITVVPAVKKPLTLRVVDTPASDILSKTCRSIKCEYRFDGTPLKDVLDTIALVQRRLSPF
jgi:hypothetical protein